jgi:hypothetical protein
MLSEDLAEPDCCLSAPVNAFSHSEVRGMQQEIAVAGKLVTFVGREHAYMVSEGVREGA